MTYVGEGPGDTVFEGIAQDGTTMPEQELWELEIGPAHNLEEYGVNLVNWNEGVAIVLESIVYTADSSATASEIAAGLAFRWNLNLEMSALATATVQGDTVSFTGDPSLSFSITEDENADDMELTVVDDVNVTYGWARVEVSGTTIQDLTIQNMYRKGISATGSDKTGLVIDNVEVTDTFGPGIYVQGAHEHNWSGVEIMNSTIDNTCNGAEELDELAVAGECLHISFTDDFEIHDNIVTDCWKESVSVGNGSSVGEIYNNTIVGTSDTSHDYGVGIYLNGHLRGINNIHVYNNYISYFLSPSHGSGITISHEDCGEVKYIYIYNNIIHHCNRGIAVREFHGGGAYPDACSGADQDIEEIYVFLNTVADSTNTNSTNSIGLEINAATVHDAFFTNNIVVDTDGNYDIVVVDCVDDILVEQVELHNNIYNIYNGNQSYCNHDFDEDLVGYNPQYLNPPFYHISYLSDAIDIADPIYVYEGVDWDVDDEERGQDMDVGADVYVGGN